MTRAIGFVLVLVIWFNACIAADLAAQGAPSQAGQADAREMSPAEAKLLFQQWVAATFAPRPEPKEPEWSPLEPDVQEWVDRVLEHWEKQSAKVKTLECTFQEWEYDPDYTPNLVRRLQAKGELEKLPVARYSSGVIKYVAPEKMLYRADRLQVIQAVHAGAAPTYSSERQENYLRWITDGKHFIAFDAIRKEVLESELPEEWQGQSLSKGLPFPFWGPSMAFQLLCGVQAESLKDRFWIRPLQAEAKGEYCLELIPKSRQDAANFHSLQIVLDDAILPVKMQVFEYDWSPTKPHRTMYKFDKRVNDPKFAFGSLTNVQTPAGWRRVVRDANGNMVRHVAKLP